MLKRSILITHIGNSNMAKLTQHQLVMLYCQENGKITPAKIAGFVYQDIMFGSETSKRCRELRDANSPNNKYKVKILDSEKVEKFEVFFLTEIGKRIVAQYQPQDNSIANYVNGFINAEPKQENLV